MKEYAGYTANYMLMPSDLPSGPEFVGLAEITLLLSEPHYSLAAGTTSLYSDRGKLDQVRLGLTVKTIDDLIETLKETRVGLMELEESCRPTSKGD